jgi:hypothetical protein
MDGQLILNSRGQQWIVETTAGVTKVCFQFYITKNKRNDFFCSLNSSYLKYQFDHLKLNLSIQLMEMCQEM